MSAAAEAREILLSEEPEPPFKAAKYSMFVPCDSPAHSQREWRVKVYPGASNLVKRRVWLDGQRLRSAEGVIWPTWPERSQDEVAAAGAPLKDTQKYWSTAGNRLRDAAKWTATVLGAGLAALVGTSPLRGMSEHRISGAAIALAITGLVLVGITLILVLLVMCPRSVSLDDVEDAGPRGVLPQWNWLRTPLYKWRQTVESEQDLYLPCGIDSVSSLRQSMSIEECTLMALPLAGATAHDEQVRDVLHAAQTARAVRLLELRTAATQVATIGEYYNLKRRSTRATIGGVILGVAATACIVAAFTWPVH